MPKKPPVHEIGEVTDSEFVNDFTSFINRSRRQDALRTRFTNETNTLYPEGAPAAWGSSHPPMERPTLGGPTNTEPEVLSERPLTPSTRLRGWRQAFEGISQAGRDTPMTPVLERPWPREYVDNDYYGEERRTIDDDIRRAQAADRNPAQTREAISRARSRVPDFDALEYVRRTDPLVHARQDLEPDADSRLRSAVARIGTAGRERNRLMREYGRPSEGLIKKSSSIRGLGALAGAAAATKLGTELYGWWRTKDKKK